MVTSLAYMLATYGSIVILAFWLSHVSHLVTMQHARQTGLHVSCAGVLDRPDFGTGTPTLTPSTESNFGAIDIGGSKALGGGDFRVLLLDSESHTEQLVVDVITEVIATVDEQHARNCFATSKQLGQALVTSCLKEHAELYTDQMQRKGCKASMEPDTTTM